MLWIFWNPRSHCVYNTFEIVLCLVSLGLFFISLLKPSKSFLSFLDLFFGQCYRTIRNTLNSIQTIRNRTLLLYLLRFSWLSICWGFLSRIRWWSIVAGSIISFIGLWSFSLVLNRRYLLPISFFNFSINFVQLKKTSPCQFKLKGYSWSCYIFFFQKIGSSNFIKTINCESC